MTGKTKLDLRAIVPGTNRSFAEEIASAAIQGTGAMLGIAGLVVLSLRAWEVQSTLALVGAVVYGLSLIVAFAASALYHGTLEPRIKRGLRAFDHCSIFVLIAGTYTPIALLALWRHDGWFLLASIWALAISGAVLRLWQGPRFHRHAIPLYLAMGWLSMGWSKALYDTIGLMPILLFAAGGLAYTGGLMFYRWNGLRFSNPLWHLCVVTGSACFFVAILVYVFPAAA